MQVSTMNNLVNDFNSCLQEHWAGTYRYDLVLIILYFNCKIYYIMQKGTRFAAVARFIEHFCWQNEFKRTSPENSHAVCACSLMSPAQEKPVNERFSSFCNTSSNCSVNQN